MPKCKFCGNNVTNGTKHHCSQMRAAGHSEQTVSDGGDFFLSAIVAAATDSAIIGGLVGGSFSGGIVGDMIDGDLTD